MTTEDVLRQFEERIRKQDERIARLEKENRKLRDTIDRLSGELRKYKNSNTPSSANQHLKPDKPLANASGKRGAPLNHLGTTRPWKEPDEKRVITAGECPNCHSTNIAKVGQQHQQVEELPPDIKPVVIDVYRDVCKCNDCKRRFVATDGRTPLQGRFGIRLMALTVFLKFIVRGVLRKTSSFLETGFALDVTPATINAIIARVAQAAESEYDGLKEEIRRSRIVYVDETSFSVLGAKWWVWVFRNDTSVLLVIRHSRKHDVLEEILTKQFTGVVVCDGWRAYDYLENASIQRCWAHLLRKSAELETARGRHFNEKLKCLFGKVARFNAKPCSEKRRLAKYSQMTRKLKEISGYYSQYDDCIGITKYIGFRLNEWFTCIRLDSVEPTNNYAEQAIRETVMVRKIIGAFRSVGGVKVYETLASVLATWQFQKKDINTELNRMLITRMC